MLPHQHGHTEHARGFGGCIRPDLTPGHKGLPGNRRTVLIETPSSRAIVFLPTPRSRSAWIAVTTSPSITGTSAAGDTSAALSNSIRPPRRGSELVSRCVDHVRVDVERRADACVSELLLRDCHRHLQIGHEGAVDMAELMPRHAPSSPASTAAGCTTRVKSFDSRNGSPFRLPNTRSPGSWRLTCSRCSVSTLTARGESSVSPVAFSALGTCPRTPTRVRPTCRGRDRARPNATPAGPLRADLPGGDSQTAS